MSRVKDKTEDEKKKKRKRWLILLLLLLLLTVGGGIWYKMSHTHPQVASGFPELATEKMTEEQLKKYAEKKANEGQVSVQVYREVKLNPDGKTGTIWVQNPPTNKEGQLVTLKDKATGEVLYESDLLKPGYQLSKVTLKKAMPKGKTKGIVTLSLYDLKAKKKVGETNVVVDIIVQ